MLKKRLDHLSIVGDELVDVDFTVLVGVDFLELLSHLLFELGGAPLRGELREDLLERDAVVAILVNEAETEILVNLILLLLGKLTLGDEAVKPCWVKSLMGEASICFLVDWALANSVTLLLRRI